MKHARCYAILLATFAPALLPAAAHAQDLSASDTTKILAAVLAEFRTSNGPIVEIVPDVPCTFTGIPALRRGEGDSCRSEATDLAVLGYAGEHGADLAAAGDPLPFCRWSGIDSPARNGVRLLLRPIRTVEPESPAGPRPISSVRGELRAGLLIACRGYPGQAERLFLHSVEYELTRLDGEWKAGNALSIIT